MLAMLVPQSVFQPWPTFTLWQYTDGDIGPEPHETPGTNGADRNIFQGTVRQLRDLWPFTRREEGAAYGAGFTHILNSPAYAKSKGAAKKKPGRRRS